MNALLSNSSLPNFSKDNLCFWRCIAIALYEFSSQQIGKKDSKIQREKAIALRDQYFKQCGQRITDHVQVADLPAICQALNLDLTVYTLDSNLNSVKLYKSGNQGSAICQHLDQVKNHYMLLRTLVGYAETVICDKCKKVFAYSNSSRYHKHMAKHQKDQNSNKVLVFKDKPIQSSSTQYKQAFGTELVRPLFLAYDFECILKKMKQIYTLDSNLNSVKLYKSGIQGSAICLHLDQVKNHYMLLRTLVGYAETVICDKCKKVFAYSNSSKYHKYMAKHQKDQNSNKVLVFKDKPIQSSSTQYKQVFGTELVRPLFLAYDFE
ncbi:hypothetical protein PROFUN_16427 [Planoprotostelium fungivorum]|uniref:C2H2-type domain-containing protein n=1 Tax=Planoprotostelium fungivorum TaxID=1890364 RepID=A0A2P6MN33_9EUKA|nr:hypothetical protein PROFUN_16427 [Planoprotostelium fungivorum]